MNLVSGPTYVKVAHFVFCVWDFGGGGRVWCRGLGLCGVNGKELLSRMFLIVLVSCLYSLSCSWKEFSLWYMNLTTARTCGRWGGLRSGG
jgi:hypothetical protein